MSGETGQKERSRQMLDGFDVASGAPDGPTLGGEAVPLSSLIDHGIRLQWYEAVAVVQETCERRGGDRAPEPIPDLQHIWICSDGRLAVSPGTVATETTPAQPVAALGQLLRWLVDEVGFPIQLELVVQSAMSPTPPYRTVAEFSKALVRFERPNRALALREVYGRWNELPAEVRSAAVPAVPPPPLPPVTLPVAPVAFDANAMDLFLPEKAPRRGRRFPILPVAAAASVILAAAGVAAWSLPGESPQPPSVPPQPVVFSEARKVAGLVPQDWATAADPETVGDSLGLDIIPGQGLPVDPPPAGRAHGPASSLTSGGPGARLAARAASARTSEALSANAKLPPAAPPTGNVGSAVVVSPASPLPAATVDERLVVQPSDPTGPVYDSSDDGVVPPELIQPRLSLVPPAGTSPDAFSVFDVLISDDGRVETVRLAGAARDYREAMFFSAAKMWRFRPAMKDGQAVRYMKRVWIAISAIGTTIR
jgi:hypothetical protein